jgi:Protein of unknown function (DUF1236)
MKKTLFSMVAVSVIMTGAVVASAQNMAPASSAWNDDQGVTLHTYSTTKHYSSFRDPSVHAEVGTELPRTVTMYPLPDTMKVPSADKYSYGMVNDHPVVVERTTRKVVHSWD